MMHKAFDEAKHPRGPDGKWIPLGESALRGLSNTELDERQALVHDLAKPNPSMWGPAIEENARIKAERERRRVVGAGQSSNPHPAASDSIAIGVNRNPGPHRSSNRGPGGIRPPLIADDPLGYRKKLTAMNDNELRREALLHGSKESPRAQKINDELAHRRDAQGPIGGELADRLGGWGEVDRIISSGPPARGSNEFARYVMAWAARMNTTPGEVRRLLPGS